MKSPILLGLEEEVFSIKTAFVSFLPSRFLLSLDFWSFLVPSYSFRSMMLFKRCFYILPAFRLFKSSSRKEWEQDWHATLTKSYLQDWPLAGVWWLPTIPRTAQSGSLSLKLSVPATWFMLNIRWTPTSFSGVWNFGPRYVEKAHMFSLR